MIFKLRNLIKKKSLQRSKCNVESGFTLIEILLYITLATMIVMTIILFFLMILAGRQRSVAIAEVDTQGSQIMRYLSYNLRNADGVNTPATGDSSSILSVQSSDPNLDPINFYVDGSMLYVEESLSDTYELSSSRVEISNVSFTNITANNSPTLIKIEFTLSYRNPDNKKELDYSKTFYNSVIINTY